MERKKERVGKRRKERVGKCAVNVLNFMHEDKVFCVMALRLTNEIRAYCNVLLTVHLIIILVIHQLNAQILVLY